MPSLDNEFKDGAGVLSSPKSRRSFLKLMSASLALAGLSGCGPFRKPTKHITPYAKQPEYVIPGKSVFYATSMSYGEESTGLLVESFEGRPTKIEGNPLHPNSLGASDGFHQASVLDLYDPDRLQDPQHNNKKVSKAKVNAQLKKIHSRYAGKGKGLAFLLETPTSPSVFRTLREIQTLYPEADLFRYDPINRDNLYKGLQLVSNKKITPDYNFEKANIIVSFDSDFLGKGSNSLTHQRHFSKRRDPHHKKGMNRLYVIENELSVTGGKADHRVAIKSSDIEGALWLISHKLITSRQIKSSRIPASLKPLIKTGAEKAKGLISAKFVDAVTRDLIQNKGKSILIASDRQPETVHALIAILNQVLRNEKETVSYRNHATAKEPITKKSNIESIQTLHSTIQSGAIQTLIILGGNPVYNTPADLPLKNTLKKVTETIHLSLYKNETSHACDWVIPKSHYLETWGDAITTDGTTSLVQPLLNPMYNSYTELEILTRLLNKKESDFETVQKTMQLQQNFSKRNWKKWLHEGVVKTQTRRLPLLSLDETKLEKRLNQNTSQYQTNASFFELNFIADASVYDGRFINNAWLQEVPDPVSKLTWDNALYLSPKTASRLRVSNGDQVVIKTSRQEKTLPVLIIPGHADASGSISLGYGQEKSGRIGNKAGFNIYTLQSSSQPHYQNGVHIQKTKGNYPLALTQEENILHDRPIYREASIKEYKAHPTMIQERVEYPPLKSIWKEKKYTEGYQWGMTIDLGKCIGCNSCMIACQSENNIPIVGKEEVINGRDMHWIRIDRYYIEEEGAVHMAQQPVACVHCEMAPCEQVCPVAATVHDEEGLNTMVYNRCIGTRYCANNCPYKVRRFNYFDWHQKNPQSIQKEREHFFDYIREASKTTQKQFNPDVTVRMRGMMEKCTYCVQRINESKSNAANQNRLVKDGEVITACEQVCASEAITFGNILDKKSKVSKLRKSPLAYAMLAELNIKPRTLYLAQIRNPHPSLSPETKGKTHASH
ncbi:molybdopterin oxidoreductase [Candidatus Marinamargulisbacteria bacterium SCGC AG-439-L15]|nr:molybdopterin oxidoreductase [Candidatus Marinamargulisbacteria bacterium SCGC AG-439-L15]